MPSASFSDVGLLPAAILSGGIFYLPGRLDKASSAPAEQAPGAHELTRESGP
ncbi:MAG: hypothetical protein ACRDJH_15960 [Thermomicrobiales bacterium]